MNPRPGDRPPDSGEILNPAVDHEVHWTPIAAFRVCFEMNEPFSWIAVRFQHRLRQLDRVGTWVDQTGDGLPVPLEHERDVIPMRWRGAPIAVPRADQRMTLLRKQEQDQG